MTTLTRRGFFGLAGAAALRPGAPGPYMRVEVLVQRQWVQHRPDGLRVVRSGERFRTVWPGTDMVYIEGIADCDGFVDKDCDGLLCGVIDYSEVL